MSIWELSGAEGAADLRRDLSPGAGVHGRVPSRGALTHHGTGVPSQEKNAPVGPSSGRSASRTAPSAASAGSPPLEAARGLRSVARSPGASALTLKPSSASV